jgi:hypothetical protein
MGFLRIAEGLRQTLIIAEHGDVGNDKRVEQGNDERVDLGFSLAVKRLN